MKKEIRVVPRWWIRMSEFVEKLVVGRTEDLVVSEELF